MKSFVPRLVAALLCAVLPIAAGARDPYHAKDLRTVLAADTGIDASKIQSTHVARCARVDPNKLYYEYGKISAPFQDCLIVEFADAFEIFEFHEEYIRDEKKQRWQLDYSNRGWRALLRVAPLTVQGVKVAETGTTPLRQIQVKQLDDLIFVFGYVGGLLGDNKYPRVAIARLRALGLPEIGGVDYVTPVVPKSRTLIIY